MRDAPIMTVANAFDDLFEDAFGLLFVESAVLLALEVAMETAPAHILHDQDHVLRSVDHLIQADDVLVAHFLHKFDFAFDALSAIRVEQLGLLVDFHGYLFVRRAVQADTHYGVGALADLLPDHVVVEGVLITEDHAIVKWISTGSRHFLLLLRLHLRLLGFVRSGLVSSSIMHVLSLSLLQLRECILTLLRAALLQILLVLWCHLPRLRLLLSFLLPCGLL